MHHRPGRDRGLEMTSRALPQMPALEHPRAAPAAGPTQEPIRPPRRRQVLKARSLRREVVLELHDRSREAWPTHRRTVDPPPDGTGYALVRRTESRLGAGVLQLAGDRPVGLLRVHEADPDLVAGHLAFFGEHVREPLGDRSLLLGRAALEPLDGHVRHVFRTLGVTPPARARSPAPAGSWAARPRSGGPPRRS